MVEFNYQMVLSTVQTVSLIIGVIYYIFIMRNSQKTRELTLKAQEHALETRQTQLFMQLYSELSTVEFRKKVNELLNRNWTDFNDFMTKYGPDENPDA